MVILSENSMHNFHKQSICRNRPIHATDVFHFGLLANTCYNMSVFNVRACTWGANITERPKTEGHNIVVLKLLLKFIQRKQNKKLSGKYMTSCHTQRGHKLE